MLSNHQKIVSALTQWDIKQSKRDRHHNPHFIGIALISLASVEQDMPNASAEDIAREAFEGHCLEFILKCLHPDEVS